MISKDGNKWISVIAMDGKKYVQFNFIVSKNLAQGTKITDSVHYYS